MRATTAWGTELYREIGVTYSVYPCSSSQYSIALTKGLPDEFYSDDFHDLWYDAITGVTYPNGQLEDTNPPMPVTIKMALEHANVTNPFFESSNNCCPVTGYVMYDLPSTDNTPEKPTATCRWNSYWGNNGGNLWCCQNDGCGGNPRPDSECATVGFFGQASLDTCNKPGEYATKAAATTGPLSTLAYIKDGDNLDQATVVINNAEMFAQPKHTKDFVLKAITPGMEGGEFKLRAKYRNCVASEIKLEAQEICTSMDHSPTNQQALRSFFNVGMPNQDGVYCEFESYQLEDMETHQTTDNALDHLVLKGANVGIDSTGKLLQTTRDVKQLDPTSVSFYLRGTTAWGTSVVRELTLNYVDFTGCGDEVLSMNPMYEKGNSPDNRLEILYDGRSGT